MGVARVLVSEELLIAALRFPAGTRIVNAGRRSIDGQLVLTVVHADLRAVTADADALPPIVKPIFRSAPVVTTGAIFVGWGQD